MGVSTRGMRVHASKVRHMERTRWWDYVERLRDAAGWSNADLSRAADVDQSVIGRWQNHGAIPEPRTVRAVALAFGRDVREAAIAAGMFTADELMATDAPLIDPYTFDLSVIPDERLRDEVYERMRGKRRAAAAPKARARRGSGARNGAGTSTPVSTAGGKSTTDIAPNDHAPNGATRP